MIEDRKSVLTFEEKEEIFRRHSLGDSVTELAIRFNVYRTTVKSVINSYRKRKGKPAKRSVSKTFVVCSYSSVGELSFICCQLTVFMKYKTETVIEAIRLKEQGVTTSVISKKPLAPTSTINEWLKNDFSQVFERSSQWCELRHSQARTAH
ncbi:hypothetical protein [uncultured Parasutterella sp.]|uniref:hypothetical protein n=1 Tax=uncultured Parasutterella sp. TaxID=1263098 RepID=UPI0034512E9C